MDTRNRLPIMNPNFRFGTSEGPFPQSLPLAPTLPPSAMRILNERRPSLPLSPVIASPRHGSQSSADSALSEQGTFYQRLRIDIKQPVGNMSISPSNRDVCLASRKGLFIIDLERPYETPRFLPQGGTWEVADVQWNPHPSRANFIVSTSSQKLLIWDLCATGQTSIIRILNAHYRAITDVNWSPFEPDLIASCGIDSWVWAWDLRAGQKPVFGLSAWESPATQVKWNRQDRHLLASSHDDKVLIWDDRKGSMPLTTIHAHAGAKIYGIDWSRSARNELVTCSLDKTIKFWAIDTLSSSPQAPLDRVPPGYQNLYAPKAALHTKYPVWRARCLPFGDGIMCLPQRGETAVEMYRNDLLEAPIWRADGHSDVVKEFVWRTRGGDDPACDDREFQLVTWSKDHTLRLWPIPPAVLQAAGHRPGSEIKVLVTRRGAKNESFRDPPKVSDRVVPEPMLSAPLGNRGILAGVRAGVYRGGTEVPSAHPSGPPSTTQTMKGTPTSSDGHQSSTEITRRTPVPQISLVSPSITVKSALPSRYMTPGKMGGNKPHRPGFGMSVLGDQMAWISSVTLEKRDGSSAAGSGSGPTSRIPSRSRATSTDRALNERGRLGRRSESRSFDMEAQEHELPEHLADELAIIGRRFGTRVTCERADVSKKRTCTFTLLGPWRDDFALTFIRISFEFPKDYWKCLNDPNATSVPSFDLDKIAGISLKTRAFLLKKLRAIRVQKRPCLESCLRFLLGESRSFGYPYARSDGSGSDDDSVAEGVRDQSSIDKDGRDAPTTVKNKQGIIIRPRRSQGVFGPNGELVCFFLNSPVRTYPGVGRRPASPSPSIASRSTGRPRAFEPAISQALRVLSRLTNDGSGVPMEPEIRPRIGMHFMDSMFMNSKQLRSTTRESRDTRASSSHNSRPISSVSIKYFSTLPLLDRVLGADYIIEAKHPAIRCLANAKIANLRGRFDHERVWTMLHRLIVPSVPDYNSHKSHHAQKATSQNKENQLPGNPDPASDDLHSVRWGTHPLAMQIVKQIYDDFARKQDLQMLAMVSITLLEIDRIIAKQLQGLQGTTPIEPIAPKPRVSIDYFSLRPREARHPSPQTPTSWPKISSFTSSSSLNLSFPSSRGSWTNMVIPTRLLGTAHDAPPSPNPQGAYTMLSGIQKRERTPSTATNPPQGSPKTPFYVGGVIADLGNRIGTTSIPVPSGKASESPKRKSSMLLGKPTESPPGALRAWSEPSPAPSPARIGVTFASGGYKRWPAHGGGSRMMTSVKEKKKIVTLAMSVDEEEQALYCVPFITSSEERSMREAHILAYAEMLYRWELPHKRAELLKCISVETFSATQRELLRQYNGIDPEGQISIAELCSMCSAELEPGLQGRCMPCRRKNQKMRCSVCRLPSNGLSHTCLKCCHVTHYACWRTYKLRSCPTGCGCSCTDASGNFEVDGTTVPLILPSVPPTPDTFSPVTTSTVISRLHSPEMPGLEAFMGRA